MCVGEVGHGTLALWGAVFLILGDYMAKRLTEKDKQYWIRCFMCQNDATDAATMEEAIQNWELDNAV